MGSPRALTVTSIGASAALAAAAGGLTWHYAGRVIEPPGARPRTPTAADHLEIVAVGEDHLTLRGPDAARPGWWGLAWDRGYARVGPPTSAAAMVTRPVELATARPRPGTRALLDACAAPDDPDMLSGVGVPATEVVVDGPLGGLPCWHWPGTSSTWAILVHGRSGARRETFRLVPTLLQAGLPTVAISYRNDPDAPPSPDGRSHLGATEWEDLEAVVTWARTQGARDVVLVGLSMGGACIGELLARSPQAAAVRAVVLDAPVLHWGPVIRRAAVERGLPGPLLGMLLPATMALAARRTRIDWAGLDHLHDAGDFDLPTLLMHGTADRTVPVELADAFADTRRDIVTYLRVEGADHLWSWNLARRRYERALAEFLVRIAASPGPHGATTRSAPARFSS